MRFIQFFICCMFLLFNQGIILGSNENDCSDGTESIIETMHSAGDVLRVDYGVKANGRDQLSTEYDIEQDWVKERLSIFSKECADEFQKIYKDYQGVVSKNIDNGWGYGWSHDFLVAAEYKPKNYFMPTPLPNDGSRPPGICNEWADSVEQGILNNNKEVFKCWNVEVVARSGSSSHYAVSVKPKNKKDGFVFDAWANGKAEIYEPNEWHKGSTLGRFARGYSDMIDTATSFWKKVISD